MSDAKSSATVDERVVSMQFDNRHFEKNVQTTMSTLNKLKQSLKFTGATKGLEDINSAANKVNMTHLGKGVETVKAKFSALEVMGVTALANITNAAVNAGKKMISALTIDPIKTGFQEYETQINSVQTILSNTKHKGSTLDDVNKALKELNTYADQTIYNFTEMTRNIGTFTAAGVDLDKSVTSIKGIANLAAISGSSSQQASTAMYQLSQALAAGRVSLMDWNSVVNAGMGGEVFQNALKRTAEKEGHNVDKLIKKYGSFRESLTEGKWLTADVLTETLTQLSGAYTKADLIAKGYTEEQAKDIVALANDAKGAATDVKTFTQLWDVMKESAQSGWTQTWELIVGDYEQAKEVLSKISKFLTGENGIITKMSEARNRILGGALGKNFKKLAKQITGVTAPVKKTVKTVNNAVKTLGDYNKVVEQIIDGDWGKGKDRWDSLTKAGYDWAHAQNLVNEKLGDGTRHSTDYKKAQDEVSKTHSKTIAKLIEMSDEQLKNAGYSDKQVKALRELEQQADKLGMPIDKFLNKIDEIDGRFLFMQSFENMGKSIVKTAKVIKKAWEDVFPPKSEKEKTEQLFDIIATLHKFSTELKMDKETADEVRRTFRGLFAILDIVATLVGGPLKYAFDGIVGFLDKMDIDILSLTASAGDAIVAFRDWIDANNIFTKGLEILEPYLEKAAKNVKEWFDGLKEADNIPEYILSGLVNGLRSGAKLAVNAIINIGKDLLEGIKNVLGIHSPSREFFSVGENIIDGLLNGLQNGASSVWNTIKDIALKCVDFVKKIDFGKLFASGIIVGTIVVAKKMLDVVESFSAPFEGIGEMFEGIGASFKASALKKKSQAALNLAIAIGILAASVALLANLDSSGLQQALFAIGAISGVIVSLAYVADKMGGVSVDSNFGKISAAMFGISTSILLIAIALKQISEIKSDRLDDSLLALGGVIVGLSIVLATFAAITKGGLAGGIDKAGLMLIGMSAALLILTVVIKRISELRGEDVLKGIVVIGAISNLFLGIVAVSAIAGQNATKAGGMLLLMSGAMLIMTQVIKQISGIPLADIIKGLAVITAIELLFAGIIAVSAFAGPNATKAGLMISAMSGALMAVVSVMKIVSQMSVGEIVKGIGVITAIEILFAGVIAISSLAGKNAAKAGGMLLAMSGALVVMTGVLYILSKMDGEGVGRALGIISVLEVLFGGLIAVSSMAQECKGTLIVLTIVIALLAGALVGLSFIDSKSLLSAAGALSSVIGVFALLMSATSMLTTFNAGTIGSLIGLVGVVAVLGAVIKSLGLLDTTASVGAAMSLSTLLLAMSGALAVLSAIGSIASNSFVAIGALTAMAIPLIAFVGVLAAMQGVQNATANALVLTGLATAMTVLLIPLSAVGMLIMATGGLILTGVLALTAMAIPLIAFVGVLAAMQGIQNAETNANLLTSLMVTMSDVLLKISLVAPLALMGVVAMSGLIGLMSVVGLFAVAIGALMEKFPSIQKFLDTGIPVMEQLSYAIGSFVGNMIAGFVGGTASSLPVLGKMLSEFMINATPFIMGAKMADGKVLAGVGILAGSVVVLTAAKVVSGIGAFMGGSFALLGLELSAFMMNAMPFIMGASLLNADMMAGVKALAETVLILTAANVIDGLLSFVTGDTSSSLATFGSNLGELGSSINTFASNIGDFDKKKVQSVKCASEALKTIAEASKEIPNTGGLLADLVGDNDISDFGSKLPELGKSIKQFANKVDGFDKKKVKAVDSAANAIKVIAEASKEIPNTGGLLAAFVGDNDLGSFGEMLPELGKDINQFANKMSGFDDTKVKAVGCAINAIKTLALTAKEIPNTGGMLAAFVGDNDLGDFGSKLPDLGKAVRDFVAEAGDVEVYKATNAVDTIKALVDLSNSSLTSSGSLLTNFAGHVNGFATELKSFIGSMDSVSSGSIKTAVSKIKSLIDFVKKNTPIDSSNISDFGKTLSDVGVTGVKKFVEAFTNTNAVSKVKNTAKSMLTNFIVGAKLKTSDVEKSFEVISKKGIAQLDGNYEAFKKSGKYLVEGFVNGIRDNMWRVEEEAAKLGKTAKEATKKQLDEHSPSKEFYKIGAFAGEGFIMAFADYKSKSYDAGSGLADLATKGLGNAISKVRSIIENGIDTQPTIRPVLDLSDVSAGAGTLNGMFDLSPSVGVMSNVRSISAMMNGNQNGGNDDVISAIDKLGKSIDNMSGTSYHIDGITYDDGSNVASAVQSLVRAARVERRV